MRLFLPIGAVAFALLVIWVLGGGAFGRAQTQHWIDEVRGRLWLHGILTRWHGNIRAAAHYVEFGGLFLTLYWLQDAIRNDGFVFRWSIAGGIAVVCAVAAWLDEVHQLKSGTRQFRRVDFLHSCCGITIAMGVVWGQWALRGFPQ